MLIHRIMRMSVGAALCAGLLYAPMSAAANAPPWMRAQLNLALPPHDDKAVAVVLYAETIFTVEPNGRMKRLDRRVTKILRPDGEARGMVRADFDAQSPVLRMQAWSIPATGKDYETKDKDAIEMPVQVSGGELMSDLRTKVLRIPAATVGSVVGYEIEQEVHPNLLLEEWEFQDIIPVRESHLTVSLPHGWTYQTRWLNHADEPPVETAPGQWSWTLREVPPIRLESHMPPWQGISGQMLVALVPPNGQATTQSWDVVGAWYANLTRERLDATPEIKRKVAELTAGAASPLEKMQAIAHFVQTDIRYVAIELGIGSYQPHAAADVFNHRYGDCKDKVTLMRTMLKEIGIDSHYVLINTQRGSIVANSPPNLGFDHAILAIDLTANLDAAGLAARSAAGTGMPLLFFDPTDELTAFGSLSGALQANYGLVVTATGGSLVELPQLSVDSNGVDRTAAFVLDESGTLRGDVHEVRRGDRAAAERSALRSANLDTDRIKPVEAEVGSSLASFEISKAVVVNLHSENQPLEWKYTLEAPSYGKAAGDVVLVRPRVLGSFSSAMMEAKEPRENPIEFGGPEHDSDVFDITLPSNYTVDELPPPVDLEHAFASYHSKTVVVGHVMRCTRTFEIKQLTLPAASAEQLRQFFRTIAADERNSAVLVRASN